MIHNNSPFTCLHCQRPIPPAEQTCRNHCPYCLFSRHVDLLTPGDRQSQCLAMMEPVRLDQNGKKGWMILHQCLQCGKEIANKTAHDDSSEALIELSKKSNISQN